MSVTRTLTTVLCLGAAGTLAICLGLERQACARLAQQNSLLRQQLNPLDQVLADTQQLSNSLARSDAAQPQSNAPGVAVPLPEAQEIARLRTEVEALRQQSQALQGSGAVGAGTRTSRTGAGNGSGSAAGTGSQLEIIQATYGTASTNLDVSEELRQRIRNDSLAALASNNLKGDPEYGQSKHLIVVYRYGGVLMTNEYREGEFFAIPAQ